MKSPKDYLYEKVIEMRKELDRIKFTAPITDMVKIENRIINFQDSIAILNERNNLKKFDKYEQREIKRMRRGGLNAVQISKNLNCDPGTIYRLLNNNK